MAEKKIGVVCDSFKIPKYTKEFKDKGYSVGAIQPINSTSFSFTITADESQVPAIEKLLRALEYQSNSN